MSGHWSVDLGTYLAPETLPNRMQSRLICKGQQLAPGIDLSVREVAVLSGCEAALRSNRAQWRHQHLH